MNSFRLRVCSEVRCAATVRIQNKPSLEKGLQGSTALCSKALVQAPGHCWKEAPTQLASAWGPSCLVGWEMRATPSCVGRESVPDPRGLMLSSRAHLQTGAVSGIKGNLQPCRRKCNETLLCTFPSWKEVAHSDSLPRPSRI